MSIAGHSRCLLSLIFVGSIWPCFAMAQQSIGVHAAVNPQATVTPPGGPKRTLVIGLNVIYREHLTTGPLGQTEIEFVDQSSLTMGPNADMDIDQFVYNPNASTGKVTLSMTRGIFRYVGGKVSKLDNAVTLDTPSATIGIRGGEILANVEPGGGVTTVLIYGKELVVTGATGASERLSRVGFAIRVARPGAAPSAPFPVSPAAIAAYLAQLDGRAGSNGGAPVLPTNQTIAQSGVPPTISGNLARSVQAAAQNSPLATSPPTIDLPFLQTNYQIQLVQGQSALANSSTNSSPSYQIQLVQGQSALANSSTNSSPSSQIQLVQGQSALANSSTNSSPSSPTPPTPAAVSFSASGSATIVSSDPHLGPYMGTLSYPDSSLQNGSLLVTVPNVIQANPNITLNHGKQLLSSVPNFASYLAGFSGGATLGPLNAGGTNIPVTLTVAGSYNGPPISATPTPISNVSTNLGTVASGTATVSADGQFFSANLTGTQNISINGNSLLNSSIFLFGGVPTVTMPTSGVGTFSGIANGAISNNGAAYSASSPFTETYNFGSNSGQLQINNFDGASYVSNLSGSGNTYSGSLLGVTSRTGSVNGGFYGTSAAETGGTFSINSITGPRYVATGIFASH